MSGSNNYLFTSERLGFRQWKQADIKEMCAINTDPDVMEFFPAVQDAPQTIAFIERMQHQYREKGHCYYAVDRLEDNSFIGFIGLSEQTFEAAFTPCRDIGWRLKKDAWHQGFATEGAKRCLQHAFVDLEMLKLSAVAPQANVKSQKVMKKIGMKKIADFNHPLLKNNKELERCVLYEIKAEDIAPALEIKQNTRPAP